MKGQGKMFWSIKNSGEVQMVAKSIRRLMTSPFKTMYIQIFFKNYCCKTIEATIRKNVSNYSKLI